MVHSKQSNVAGVSSPAGNPSKGRVRAIDVMRGLLICVITFGHAQILLNDSELTQRLDLVVSRITNLGTPAFTFISGMLLGYFEATAPDFGRIRRSYFKRALQLLFFAHFLIALGTYPLREEPTFGEAFLRYWYVTDTLALLFILVPLLRTKVREAGRLLIGIAALASWPLAFLLTPASGSLLVVKEFLFGVNPRGNHLLGDTYPVVPLLGLFLIATVLGNRFGGAIRKGEAEAFVKKLKYGAPLLMILSFFMVGLWAWGKTHPAAAWSGWLRTLFYPEKLSSLLPFYLGVVFLMLAYYVRKIEVRGKFGRVERTFALFGKTSLFTYVAQYFVVQTLPSLIGWRGAMNLPEMLLYLSGAMIVLYFGADAYSRFIKRSRPERIKLPRVAGTLAVKTPSPLDDLDLPQPHKDLW